MKKYIVQSAGYTNCPTFGTLIEAQTYLKELVGDSLIMAKRRSKTATKHKLGENNYSITLGRDKRSSLWAHHWISRG